MNQTTVTAANAATPLVGPCGNGADADSDAPVGAALDAAALAAELRACEPLDLRSRALGLAAALAVALVAVAALGERWETTADAIIGALLCGASAIMFTTSIAEMVFTETMRSRGSDAARRARVSDAKAEIARLVDEPSQRPSAVAALCALGDERLAAEVVVAASRARLSRAEYSLIEDAALRQRYLDGLAADLERLASPLAAEIADRLDWERVLNQDPIWVREEAPLHLSVLAYLDRIESRGPTSAKVFEGLLALSPARERSGAPAVLLARLDETVATLAGDDDAEVFAALARDWTGTPAELLAATKLVGATGQRSSPSR